MVVIFLWQDRDNPLRWDFWKWERKSREPIVRFFDDDFRTRSQIQQACVNPNFRPLFIARRETCEVTFLYGELKRKLRFSLPLRHSGPSNSEIVVLSLSRESDGDFPKRGRPVCGEFRVGVCLGLVWVTCCFLAITAPMRSADFPDLRNFIAQLFCPKIYPRKICLSKIVYCRDFIFRLMHRSLRPRIYNIQSHITWRSNMIKLDWRIVDLRTKISCTSIYLSRK